MKNKPLGYPPSIYGYQSNEYIYINSCGNLKPTNDKINRTLGRYDYQLIYVAEGFCYLKKDGKTATVTKGEVVLYRPNEPQNYFYKEKDNTRVYWIHFTGTECNEIFNKCGFSGNIITPQKNSEIEYLLSRLCYFFHLGGKNRDTVCNGLLIAALGLVSHYAAENDIQPKTKLNSKGERLVSEVISEFKKGDSFRLNAEQCAKHCNMSPTHFSRVFKNITGFSPQQYMIKARMERAEQLLFFTEKSISEISLDVGYEDPNYFSRLFKKQFGITPKQYRNTVEK